MTKGGRIDSLLNSIPGYGGYRDKERRRDSDRVIREQLALDYGQLAERLGRLATTLARDRNIAAIPLVDRPHRRLVSFIDRIRTASYGYSPLFSDRPVQEDALDQLAAFDRSLADQQDELVKGIAALESGNPRDAEYEALSQQLAQTIEGLHDRFDRRHQVLHSGEALPHADVLALLETTAAGAPPAAYRLHDGEAVEYGGENYSVIGRVSAESGSVTWRAFQLRGGSGDRWLLATPDDAAKLLWLRRVDAVGSPGDPTVMADGTAYNLESLFAGTGEVIGQQGAAANQPVRFARYRNAAGSGVLALFDWETGRLGLAGIEVDPRDMRLFSRES
ncbi:MAG TPA: DUF4178 domain-containing protein [Thermomicrobiales bacterium]|nr:DUF4178 domain-containing protein [Thermomicrobiales bacterium]